MSSSTSSRQREPAAVTAPTRVVEKNSTSSAEERALGAIAQEVCLLIIIF